MSEGLNTFFYLLQCLDNNCLSIWLALCIHGNNKLSSEKKRKNTTVKWSRDRYGHLNVIKSYVDKPRACRTIRDFCWYFSMHVSEVITTIKIKEAMAYSLECWFSYIILIQWNNFESKIFLTTRKINYICYCLCVNLFISCGNFPTQEGQRKIEGKLNCSNKT